MSGEISRKNGKLGGRPMGNNTLTAEVAREKIALLIGPHIESVVEALLKKAKKGDIRAAKELFDRAYGRSMIIDYNVPIAPNLSTVDQIKIDQGKYK